MPVALFQLQTMQPLVLYSLLLVDHMNKRQTRPLSTFFSDAEQNAVEYIVSDSPLNDSYYIPPDAPQRIGAYQKIYQDERTSICAH